MNALIDTHTHLYTEEFDADRELAVIRAVEAGDVPRPAAALLDLARKVDAVVGADAGLAAAGRENLVGSERVGGRNRRPDERCVGNHDAVAVFARIGEDHHAVFEDDRARRTAAVGQRK